MSTLLIKNIRTLVSCDSADTVYENVDLYAEDGFIKEIGAKLDRKADKTIDASHMLKDMKKVKEMNCYPNDNSIKMIDGILVVKLEEDTEKSK